MNSSLRSAFSVKTFRSSLISLVGLALALSGLAFAIPAFATPAPGSVVINEFVSFPSSGSEWVELYNTTGSDIDLTGWKIKDLTLSGTTPTGTTTASTLSTTITAHSFIAIDVSGLNNAGDVISLMDGSDSLIDQVAYGTVDGYTSDISAPGSGESGGRSPDGSTNWVIFSVPTKNATNGAPIPSCNPSSTFDSGFALGSVNGQNGWSATSATYDQAVVDNTYGYSTFGCKSLRLSDAVTSGSFGDWVFAPAATPDSGESATKNHYEAQFDIAAAQSTEQTGLTVSVSPDNGSGGRMSYLRFEDHADGIHVFFYDVQQPGSCAPSGCANFVQTEIGTLDRSVPHTIKFVMDFLSGPGNDVVKIYIDGSLAHTGTSWEDYYRYDPEQAGNGNVVPVTNTLIFQARGTAHPANSGKGYLFDNLVLATSFIAPDTTPPSVPTLEMPTNGSATSTNDFYFTWDASTDDSGGPVTYQFHSSLDSTEAGGVLTNGLWTSPTPLTSPTIHSTGASNGTWYWQVRAQDAAGNWSDWSSIWNVTLANVVTNPATAITASDATLNGTVGSAANPESFWVSTSTFSTASTHMPSGVYSTPVLGGISAHTDFSDPLSIVTTNGIIWDGSSNQNVNMPAITPSTTYYYVAWANIGGTWYHGAVQSFTTAAPPDTTRPTLVYDYPAANVWASTTLPVSVTASDAGSGIDSVVIHPYDSTNTFLGACGTDVAGLGGLATYTHTCTLDTSALAEGLYYFKSGTFDVAGNNQTVRLDFGVDHTRPDVHLTAPADGSIRPGAFTITGTATDTTSGIDHVAVYVAHQPFSAGGYVVNADLATWDSGTGTFSYHTSGIPDGTYRVRAAAYDKAGNVQFTSPPRDVIVRNIAPTLTITMPAHTGDVATSTYTFAAQYDHGVTAHLYWGIKTGANADCEGGTVVAGNIGGHTDASTFSSPNFTATVDTTALSDGNYCFLIADNHSLRKARRFVIDNTGPIAPTIISPFDGEATTTAGLQQVSWTAVSGTGVTYLYQSSLASSTSLDGSFASPAYTSSWLSSTNIATPGTPVGTYYLHVMARDNHGNTSAWGPISSVDVMTTLPVVYTHSYATTTVEAADLTSNPISNPTSWFFYNDSTDALDNSLGSFVDGPATAPLGDGSAQIAAATGHGIVLASLGLKSIALKDLTSLSYSTYRSQGTSALDLALQFDINPTGTTTPGTYQGRLVYEPYFTHTVADDTWQTWNPMDDSTSGGHGNWWFSHGDVANPVNCSQAHPCTWSQILAAYPDIGISGGTYFKAGTWSDDFTGNVDNFVVAAKSGTTISQTTYDFEPTQAPSPSIGGGAGGPNAIDVGKGSVLGAAIGPDTGGASSTPPTSSSTPPVFGNGLCTPDALYMNSYIKRGGKNDPAQVKLLQQFLNSNQGASLPITGFYGPLSLTAVKTFQQKYADEILKPWTDAGFPQKEASGYVYKTTLRWINTLYCGLAPDALPLTLP